MSRIAKQPVPLTKGVSVTIGTEVVIQGPKGTLSMALNPAVSVEETDGSLHVSAKTMGPMQGKIRGYADAQSGAARANLSNMVRGVTQGFEKKLTIIGVGYRAELQGNKLDLKLGFSHPIVYLVPAGITVVIPSPTEVQISGADKQLVGQVAADIRAYRPVEPYKGKGVRYSDEKIILKETKKK